jgi:hypothetical protein
MCPKPLPAQYVLDVVASGEFGRRGYPIYTPHQKGLFVELFRFFTITMTILI